MIGHTRLYSFNGLLSLLEAVFRIQYNQGLPSLVKSVRLCS